MAIKVTVLCNVPSFVVTALCYQSKPRWRPVTLLVKKSYQFTTGLKPVLRVSVTRCHLLLRWCATPLSINVNFPRVISRLLSVLCWKRPPWIHPIWALLDQYLTSVSSLSYLNVSSIPGSLNMPTSMVASRLFSRPTVSSIVTKTALVKVHNGLVVSVDEGQVGALVLLDLSSAFDTVESTIRFCLASSSVGLLL